MRMPAGVAVLTALPIACANTSTPAADDTVRRLHELEKKYISTAPEITSYAVLQGDFLYKKYVWVVKEN